MTFQRQAGSSSPASAHTRPVRLTCRAATHGAGRHLSVVDFVILVVAGLLPHQ
jgi:hypothetical protein